MLSNCKQLDVENERTGGCSLGSRGVAVSERARYPEAGLVAHDHQRHALRPSLDDAIQGEADRFASAHGAVEQLSFAGPPAVVNLDRAGRRRVILPFAVLE